MSRSRLVQLIATALLCAAAACSANTDPRVPPPIPPPPDVNVPPPNPNATGTGSGTGTDTVTTPLPPVAPPVTDSLASMSLDDVNRSAALKPVFFVYDSDSLDDAARKAIEENLAILKEHGSWIVTIEGHCDERGSAEYNLALGDRRAQVVRNYLVQLGIPADRVRTVSYGKEFPFDPGHDESAWLKNRRAQFMVTAK